MERSILNRRTEIASAKVFLSIDNLLLNQNLQLSSTLSYFIRHLLGKIKDIMAPSQQPRSVSSMGNWEPSHLDRMWVNDLMELHQQNLKQREVMSMIRRQAFRMENYPDIDKEKLLADHVTERWIKNVIFVRDGQKCIIAKDIGQRKDFWFPWFEEHFDNKHRKYCVDPRGRTLSEVDHTSKNRRAFMEDTQHKSEKGWHLPQSHDRHISKFPREIFDNILGHLVQVMDAALVPRIATTNWKREFSGSPHCMPGQDCNPYTTTEVGVLTTTVHGRLLVLRRLHQSHIDATCLRVCKAWNQTGGRSLYHFNCYDFKTNNPSSETSPGSWIDGDYWRPSPRKPFVTASDDSSRIFDAKIQKGIRDIQRRVTIKKLVGWVYHDPFLRFLYMIGAKNAALLRTLSFSGEVRCHQCEQGHFCDDCLLDSFRVYIPVMNALCPNVQKLILNIKTDSQAQLESANIFERKVREFFEGELRNLRFLTELVVVDLIVDGYELPDGDIGSFSTAQLAKPTVSYFRKRAS
ncbi:hypothetical protein BELL_1056g00040 [Botrytis elliptica]|uniref:Uncharacterized protein n=1 Tax=Botrytis elliptica TaxID=278938 RepID=A0A4Z1IR73_9HELO|nr:hypothetical protein EAE99_010232 [Botrytis elliptica]TGO63991.1 hypothetical protein BELL_1056g00040 [Botrytis elliptica]